MSGFEVVPLVEVGEQVRVGGLLAQELLGTGARGGVVQGYQGGQEAEVGLGLRRGDGPRRHVEVVADGLCDPTEWDALVADRVQPGAGRGRFGGQPGTGVR
jgi:hypothetical protein